RAVLLVLRGRGRFRVRGLGLVRFGGLRLRFWFGFLFRDLQGDRLVPREQPLLGLAQHFARFVIIRGDGRGVGVDLDAPGDRLPRVVQLVAHDVGTLNETRREVDRDRGAGFAALAVLRGGTRDPVLLRVHYLFRLPLVILGIDAFPDERILGPVLLVPGDVVHHEPVGPGREGVVHRGFFIHHRAGVRVP